MNPLVRVVRKMREKRAKPPAASRALLGPAAPLPLIHRIPGKDSGSSITGPRNLDFSEVIDLACGLLVADMDLPRALD